MGARERGLGATSRFSSERSPGSDAGDYLVDLQALQSELPALSPEQFRAGLRAHDDAGYLDVRFTMGGGRVTGHVGRVHERTRRELGSWLRAAAETLAGSARDLAVQVLAAKIGQF